MGFASDYLSALCKVISGCDTTTDIIYFFYERKHAFIHFESLLQFDRASWRVKNIIVIAQVFAYAYSIKMAQWKTMCKNESYASDTYTQLCAHVYDWQLVRANCFHSSVRYGRASIKMCFFMLWPPLSLLLTHSPSSTNFTLIVCRSLKSYLRPPIFPTSCLHFFLLLTLFFVVDVVYRSSFAYFCRCCCRRRLLLKIFHWLFHIPSEFIA